MFIPERIGKSLLLAVVYAVVSGALTVSAFAGEAKVGSFNLVHWNILKKMYKVNSYLYSHRNETLQALKNDKEFMSMLTATFTPDSYVDLVDQDGIFQVHPNSSLVGKKVPDVSQGEVTNLILTAIKDDTCTRGFYIWIDGQEKYLVACPIVGKTADGYKLYYLYTMYTRSMPEYYLKTLKNSVQE